MEKGTNTKEVTKDPYSDVLALGDSPRFGQRFSLRPVSAVNIRKA